MRRLLLVFVCVAIAVPMLMMSGWIRPVLGVVVAALGVLLILRTARSAA